MMTLVQWFSVFAKQRRDKMESLQKVMGVDKPIIALLHLQALPGDPAFSPESSMQKVVEQARTDLLALQKGGVDAVLFSNEFSLPYQIKVDGVIIAAMARVVTELRKDIRVPFGVHVISDPEATIELAAAVDAAFVRSVFTGAYAGEAGIRYPDIAKILRRKSALGLNDLKMFYMINAESDGDLSGRDLSVVAQAVIFKCSPDGICVSGIHAGHGVDRRLIEDIKKVSKKTAVFCNTGCTKENIREILKSSDGAFVGTTLKKNGMFTEPVDVNRVRAFMDEVRKLRMRGNDGED
jgi:uncharacterized protein